MKIIILTDVSSIHVVFPSFTDFVFSDHPLFVNRRPSSFSSYFAYFSPSFSFFSFSFFPTFLIDFYSNNSIFFFAGRNDLNAECNNDIKSGFDTTLFYTDFTLFLPWNN